MYLLLSTPYSFSKMCFLSLSLSLHFSSLLVSTRPCALEECDMRGGTSTSCKLTSDNMMTLAKRSKTFLRSKVWELLNSCPTTAGVHHLDKLTTTKEAIKFFAENKHIHRLVHIWTLSLSLSLSHTYFAGLLVHSSQIVMVVVGLVHTHNT